MKEWKTKCTIELIELIDKIELMTKLESGRRNELVLCIDQLGHVTQSLVQLSFCQRISSTHTTPHQRAHSVKVNGFKTIKINALLLWKPYNFGKYDKIHWDSPKTKLQKFRPGCVLASPPTFDLSVCSEPWHWPGLAGRQSVVMREEWKTRWTRDDRILRVFHATCNNRACWCSTTLRHNDDDQCRPLLLQDLGLTLSECANSGGVRYKSISKTENIMYRRNRIGPFFTSCNTVPLSLWDLLFGMTSPNNPR